MSDMTLTVGGVDLTPYIASGGLKWQRNDVESQYAGRTLDGKMHRGRVAIKARLDVSCRPLTAAELSTVLTAIQPETVSVTYTNPQTNTNRTATFYSNNVPASFLIVGSDGTEYWNGVSFPLIEV